MDGPGEQGLLQRFLADRDAPCPGCGYNLRGVVGEKCPECARPIALGIVRGGSSAALTWFLLLALGWVFTAGVMNSTRNAQSIRMYVEDAQLWGLNTLRFGQLQSNTGITANRPLTANDGFWTTAWQVVPGYTWLGAAWSFGLALGCGIGLLLMMQRRTRPFGARGERRMVVLACSMFAVYAAWHITNFVLEFS